MGSHWIAPGQHERRLMMKRCGNKCFLDAPRYPICARHSCRISRRGLRAAYSRSRQMHENKLSLKARRITASTFRKKSRP